MAALANACERPRRTVMALRNRSIGRDIGVLRLSFALINKAGLLAPNQVIYIYVCYRTELLSWKNNNKYLASGGERRGIGFGIIVLDRWRDC